MTNNIDRIAYLATLGTKRPLELLLEIIEVDCYKYNFDKLDIFTSDNKSVVDILAEEYNINISEYILKKWLSTYFILDNGKLKLKKTEETLFAKINRIDVGQKDFLERIGKIRNLFMDFSKKEFNVKLDKETSKKVFDGYIYTVSSEKKASIESVQTKYYFIFQKFLRELYNNDRDNLSLIENFGIANQIQDIIVNGIYDDKEFLKGCVIFLDTPILMKLLGYDGVDLSENYMHLINDLKKAGAVIKVFEHTFEELWSILFNFKRCVAQNIFNGKGVMTFLQARKEFSNRNKPQELSLDKESVKNNIKNLNFEILDISEVDKLEDKVNYKNWEIDSSILKDCLVLADSSYQKYESRLDNDAQSIISISRMRQKESVDVSESLKSGKYYLLVDNFALLSALKTYYDKIGVKKYRNELLFENTIIFDLWQNLSENDSLNRSMFRSKCFALNTIDEKFKESLYRETRKLEIYNSELKIDHQLIYRPEIENEVYAASIKDDCIDDEYLSKTLLNVIKEKDEEINAKLRKKDSENSILLSSMEQDRKSYETSIKEQLTKNENNLKNYKLSLIEKKVSELSKKWIYKFLIYFKSFNQEFNKNKYLWEKACSIIGEYISYDEI